MIRTARVTGLLYLGLAVGGAVGFLIVRPLLFAPADPGTTYANLLENPGLARLGVGAELFTVLTQALAAAGFYRLFHAADRFAAAGVAAFGLVNAVLVLISAALLAAALPTPGLEAEAAQLCYVISAQLWSVGGLFFGLWLIPMGVGAWRVGMPRALGWILIAGGAGYLLSTFLSAVAPAAGTVADLLVIPATVGELWMIGYLLVRGVRPAVPASVV